MKNKFFSYLVVGLLLYIASLWLWISAAYIAEALGFHFWTHPGILLGAFLTMIFGTVLAAVVSHRRIL